MNGLVGILDEPLLEQTDRAVKFVEFSIDDFTDHVGRLILDLRLENGALGSHRLGGNILPADKLRLSGSDMQSDVFDEFPEIFVLGHEVGLAVHLNENPHFAL